MRRTMVLMGSGETSPTMLAAHRELLADVPAVSGAAVHLDTPYGFQENADELSDRIGRYFREAVGHEIAIVTLRGSDVAATAVGEAIAAVRRAQWVFAGPGSPTYALRVWRDTGMSSALEAALAHGSLTFASAAALTTGAFTMPVYEIYKVGATPSWVPGLDLLGHATGLRAAVIPHFDNAEGGTHDTRFCYVGERRLAQLESTLPDDCFVLGIDEHTGVRFDLESRVIHVFGRGSMTVRMSGQLWRVPAGDAVTIDEVAERTGTRLATVETSAALDWNTVHAMLDQGKVSEAVEALIALDEIGGGYETRGAVHALIGRLGNLAAHPAIDIAAVVGPYIEALLTARSAARNHGFWAEADEIRHRLDELHVRISDGPEGTTWSMSAKA